MCEAVTTILNQSMKAAHFHGTWKSGSLNMRASKNVSLGR